MSRTSPPTKPVLPPPLVALASWVLPGLGYLLIGQRKRGLVVGVAIVLLFALGLLIGGVRVLEVPGYGPGGGPLSVVQEAYTNSDRQTEVRVSLVENAEPRDGLRIVGRALRVQPLAELRQKPWSVAQVMTGPVALGGMAWSVWAADPANGQDGEPPAVPSHARVNEIGVLYTAIAGMLNLLAIIDAASRAGHLQDRRADEAAGESGSATPVAV
jgi:hypothetical protein